MLLVVAKAPVPGHAKTRLAPTFGPVGAARLAGAALLDTLDVARAVDADADVVVALAGDVGASVDPAALTAALARCRVLPQRGGSLGERLAHAHVDAARRRPCLQVGMDTPHMSVAVLGDALERLSAEARPGALLGPALDGGWWALGVAHGGDAACLRGVVMSTDRTCADTASALRRAGTAVRPLPAVRDVDTVQDVRAVAAQSDGRFAALARELLRDAS